jgi:hypothetical protein
MNWTGNRDALSEEKKKTEKRDLVKNECANWITIGGERMSGVGCNQNVWLLVGLVGG